MTTTTINSELYTKMHYRNDGKLKTSSDRKKAEEKFIATQQIRITKYMKGSFKTERE